MKVASTGLPYLAKALADRWATEVASTPASGRVLRLTVGTQTVWLVRKYLPGSGMEVGAYVQTGAMIGIAGGATENVDSWEHRPQVQTRGCSAVSRAAANPVSASRPPATEPA